MAAISDSDQVITAVDAIQEHFDDAEFVRHMAGLVSYALFKREVDICTAIERLEGSGGEG